MSISSLVEFNASKSSFAIKARSMMDGTEEIILLAFNFI